MDNLLDLIIKHWKEQGFVGLSALELAETLSKDHLEIIDDLRNLESKGTIGLRETQLGQPIKFAEIKSSDDTTVNFPIDFNIVDTVIAFPKRQVLETTFQRDGKDYGYFANRLHKGDSQIKHYYFKRDVLDKYFRFQDQYIVTEDNNGGNVDIKSEYYLSFPENTRGNLIGKIEFGNLKLHDGTMGVGVIAIDLAKLPYQEQLHWAAHEISTPQFSEENQDWDEHIDEIFNASWDAQHIDYIQLLSEVLEQINSGLISPLFTKTTNPYIHIPMLNTERDYMEAHKELFKLISADNLDGNVLKRLMLSKGFKEENFIHDSGREKGKWALLKMLCKMLGVDFSKFETINSNRQISSHKIATDFATPIAYNPEKFKVELRELIRELTKMKSKI